MTQLILGILAQMFHCSDVQNRKCTKPARGYFAPANRAIQITRLIKTANWPNSPFRHTCTEERGGVITGGTGRRLSRRAVVRIYASS
jgi:hypothetical protein